MLSPHPSYPPLEMAVAGCIAITNSYETKNLSARSSNIISLDTLSPIELSKMLDIAMQRLTIGSSAKLVDINSLPEVNCRLLDYEDLVKRLKIANLQ